MQLGQSEEALASRMIWECTSCQTCATRCPQQVSVAAMNDALRQRSVAERKADRGGAVVIFNELFLGSVRRRGRMYELGLMARFKLRTRRFFEDMGKLPLMLRKGKLALWPKRVGGRSERAAMFERIAEAGGKK
jgi:heterodisulfide reductase subunit C